ncbi:MAG TPA: hypothetical protein DCK76_07900 [Desulfotomaculum sp.]|nr:MAG: Zn-dependent hydrolase, glyoxylase [Desulfotomaculum sp. 46_80]HAG11291.1 hypothetical protein [Desulfotomaculum sp.]HBY03561.1 hypothetical protein [Desulfotomaculum sp.]
MSRLTIYPLDLGDAVVDQGMSMEKEGMGVPWKAKLLCYYIEGAEKKILVDPGVSDQEHADMWHDETNCRVTPGQSMAALEKIGAKPEEIDIILLTHLHWDHAYHLDKYKNAEIYVAKEELTYALMPLPPHYFYYEHWNIGLTPWYTKSIPRMRTIDLVPHKIVDQVIMVPTPGHTPGSMSVVVETENGPYIICGDAVMVQDNLTGNPVKRTPYTMTGHFMDCQATWRSIAFISNIVKADKTRVLATHDPAALSKSRYP